MLRTVFTRLLSALPNLVGVVVITFILTRALPGDPAAYFAGAAATEEAIAQLLFPARLGPVATGAAHLFPNSLVRFHGRCPHGEDRCAREAPPLVRVGARQVACHFAA